MQQTVVTATRVAQPLADLVADVSILDRAAIERSASADVPGLLATLPGLEVARSGSTTSVFVRGGNAQHVAVYLDGVRLDAQSGSGGATWEAIPLAQIDRIEVLRGPAAAVYGSDAVNGVIQLFTRKGEGAPAPFVSIGIGSNQRYKLDAGVSGSAGVDQVFDYSLGLSHEATDGFDSQPQHLSGRPTAQNNPDRDGSRRSSVNARLGLQLNKAHKLDATLLASDASYQYDAFGYVAARPVNDLSEHKLTTLGLNWRAQWTEAYSTRLSVTDSKTRYETRPSVYETTTLLRGYLLQNEYRVGPHLLTATLERREDELENTAVGITRTRTQDGVGMGYGYSLGRHTLQLNARHDDDSGFGGKNTGSAAYGFALTPQWRVTASAGTAFRAPTLYQRFSEYGVSSLQPETSRNLEAGLRYTQGASSVGVVVYKNKVRNLVTYVNGPGACASTFGCYDSVDSAQYKGVTFSGTHVLGAVRLRGSLDIQDPKDLGSGKDLARRARHHASVGAETDVAGWSLGAEVQTSGQRFDNAANTNVLSGYSVMNLSATTRLNREFSLLARIDNVGDKQYQTARTYATEGRSFYLGLKWAPQ